VGWDQFIHAHAHVALPGSDEGFSAELETEGAANFIVQDVIFAPGGTTGWHKHPGVLLLSLTVDSGSVDWYDAKCVKHVYNAGDSWTEGTTLHDVVNNSSSNAHFIVTYLVARRQQANRRTGAVLRGSARSDLGGHAPGAAPELHD
jgi:quercetin dioxygenase-like cupin family protein